MRSTRLTPQSAARAPRMAVSSPNLWIGRPWGGKFMTGTAGIQMPNQHSRPRSSSDLSRALHHRNLCACELNSVSPDRWMQLCWIESKCHPEPLTHATAKNGDSAGQAGTTEQLRYQSQLPLRFLQCLSV